MLIFFLWTFVHHLSWAAWSTQEIHWAPLHRGPIVGSFRGSAWGGEGPSAHVGALIAASGAGQWWAIPRQCLVLPGEDASSTGARPVSFGASP